MSRRRRHLVQTVCAVLLVGIGVGLIGLVRQSDAAEVRYAKLTCLYGETFTRSGPFSVALFGTSRMKWGVSPTVLARGLKPPKLEAPILNAGRSFRGTDHMYQQLLDVERERGITEGVVVEVALPPEPTFRAADSPFAYDYYRNFSGAVTLDRLVADLEARPSEPWHWRLSDLGGQLRRRLDLNLEFLITREDEINVALARDRRPPGTRHGDCSGGDRRYRPRAIRADEAEATPPGGTWRDQPPITTDFDAVLWERQLHYLRLFKRWGEERGLPVAFTLVPRRVDPFADPSLAVAFERVVGAPLLVPPPALRESIYADGYSDCCHLNRSGRAAYTRWLATQLKPTFNP